MAETLMLQLHKLSNSASISKDILENVLETLWSTRKTGLKAQQKSSIQSLLNLPSSQQLDPVLAYLRLLIRKCVHENLIGDDLLKLFLQLHDYTKAPSGEREVKFQLNRDTLEAMLTSAISLTRWTFVRAIAEEAKGTEAFEREIR